MEWLVIDTVGNLSCWNWVPLDIFSVIPLLVPAGIINEPIAFGEGVKSYRESMLLDYLSYFIEV